MEGDSNQAGFPSYLDFDLEIGPGRGREYPIAIVRSPAGEARETMRFPYDELALESHLKDLRIALLCSGGKRRRMLSPEEQTVQRFGQALFDALFTGEVRSRYDVSLREATQQGRGLRLRLRIQAPELAALPWEFLHDSRQAEYVCLSRNTPVVRYLELPQAIQPLTVRPPLRILGMVASPRDQPSLDVDREKQRVEVTLKDLQTGGLVDLSWLPGQTWRDLQRAMRRSSWHIFHFIGHGAFDRDTDEGFIALADEENQTHLLSATHLGRLLADHRHLRLVLLNSCEGARGSKYDIFSSTAAILVRRGIPAVLAMQYEITDRAAIEFARAFYESLADGMPVDAAVAEARKAVSFAVANTVEWGTPVLYMRSPDGVLFHIQEQERGEREAREQAAREETEHRARKKAAKEEAERKAREETARREVEQRARMEAERKAREEAETAYQRGREHHDRRDYDRAIADYTHAIQLDPQLAAAYSNRGQAHLKKGSYDQAIADCNRAIQLDPQLAVAYNSRADAYHMKGNYDQAIADHTRAIELDPQSAFAYHRRGYAYGTKGNYNQAIADCDRAIELDPQNALAYGTRGAAYRMQGNYDQAIADLTRAIQIDPQYAFAYARRGDAYRMQGNSDQAIDDLTRTIQLDPQDAFAYATRGAAYRMQGNSDQAIADLTRAIQIDPQYAFAYGTRGEAYRMQGNYDQAIADCDRAIELDPQNAFAYGTRGEAYRGKGNYDQAIADCNRAIKLDPQFAFAYRTRGAAYRMQGSYDQAIDDLTRAIELDPQSALAYRRRGDAYYTKSNYGQAIADYTRAIQLDPDSAHSYYWRGQAYRGVKQGLLSIGDQEASRRDFRRAAELGHPKAKAELAKELLRPESVEHILPLSKRRR
jgi:tetratricopeptide (TPR) repeat protein